MERLNAAALADIDNIVARHIDQPGPTIEILHEVQDQLGYVPFEAMQKISEATGTSVAEVYGIVMFYSQFTTEPKGKHVINVCLGTACYVRGADNLLEEFKRVLNIEVGETTPDGKFSLDCLRCVGACGLAPVATIDDKVYGRLNPSDIRRIISEYEAKE